MTHTIFIAGEAGITALEIRERRAVTILSFSRWNLGRSYTSGLRGAQRRRRVGCRSRRKPWPGPRGG